jgi:deoxycytidylate deaminase
MASDAVIPAASLTRSSGPSAQEIYGAADSGELVIAVVGHVGSGTSTIAGRLKEALEDGSLPGGAYEATVLKARAEILGWATRNGLDHPPGKDEDLAYVKGLQDLGNEMRSRLRDHAAVARALLSTIRATRASKLGVDRKRGAAVAPDGKRRAYIVDSVRHPDEVALLRRVYRPAFALVGVVCDTEVRRSRLHEKFRDAGKKAATEFMERDEDEGLKHGQHVADAFHLADYFINNTEEQLFSGRSNPHWDVPDQLGRLIKIIQQTEIIRPTLAETAMHAAFGAKVRSACLSRQVGACLVDTSGTIVSTGTNEVPRGGGGVYSAPQAGELDERCAFRENAYCSNSREQTTIVGELLDRLSLTGDERERAADALRGGRIGRLLEFSRAVHAEMEALLSAARSGRRTVGSRMFVTTFPCHYCARHLVSAGVDEVQYIEPYPKSQALALHDDAITTKASSWKPPSGGGSQVLFRPFTGVAPRLYERAFVKDRDLKDRTTGKLQVKAPDWGSAWAREKTSYVDLEAALTESMEAE